MIYLVDNYDSFSYNLYQLVGAARPDVRVIRNDAMSVAELAAAKPEAIILSPGPGRPGDAGICEEVVREQGGQVPILGVCLGHQAIVEALGGTVGYAKELMHGKSSRIEIAPASRLLANLGDDVRVARYHSLAADADSLPACLVVTARDTDGEVMAVEHATQPTFGVQFHPESIMTPTGAQMIANFLVLADEFNDRKDA